MAHLLHIDASPRGERSHSRRMTREFVQQWQQHHPNDAIAYRDVGLNRPKITELVVAEESISTYGRD
jgi:FMN-dependent NADH-azoreductase